MAFAWYTIFNMHKEIWVTVIIKVCGYNLIYTPVSEISVKIQVLGLNENTISILQEDRYLSRRKRILVTSRDYI